VTEWNEIEQADYAQIKNDLKQPLIFDGRNIFDPVLMDSLGFTYIGIGRGHRSVVTSSVMETHHVTSENT
jgi:UDPglucose 6-dehydrogenase